MTEFVSWPKISRLDNEQTIVTEKLDGTNGCIVIAEDGILVQSRNRFLSVEQDNYGFAAWVEANASSLLSDLGVGRHFGEWWGHGIQRNYGLGRGDRRFYLFNAGRWAKKHAEEPFEWKTPGLGTVPILYQGPAWSELANPWDIARGLYEYGSYAVPGFDKPEGIVVHMKNSGASYKITDAEAGKKVHIG